MIALRFHERLLDGTGLPETAEGNAFLRSKAEITTLGFGASPRGWWKKEVPFGR